MSVYVVSSAPVADTVPEASADADKEEEKATPAASIEELYASLSGGCSQLPFTTATARNLASTVVSFTVSLRSWPREQDCL